jgi:hypothetical protein
MAMLYNCVNRKLLQSDKKDLADSFTSLQHTPHRKRLPCRTRTWYCAYASVLHKYNCVVSHVLVSTERKLYIWNVICVNKLRWLLRKRTWGLRISAKCPQQVSPSVNNSHILFLQTRLLPVICWKSHFSFITHWQSLYLFCSWQLVTTTACEMRNACRPVGHHWLRH